MADRRLPRLFHDLGDFLNTFDRNGLPTWRTLDFLTDRPNFIMDYATRAFNGRQFNYLRTMVQAVQRLPADFRRLLPRGTLAEWDEFTAAARDLLPALTSPGSTLTRNLLFDLSASTLEHIHLDPSPPLGTTPFTAIRDIGKRFARRLQKTVPKLLVKKPRSDRPTIAAPVPEFNKRRRIEGPITEPDNLFDVTQKSANMPITSTPGGQLRITPRFGRTISSTPRRRSGGRFSRFVRTRVPRSAHRRVPRRGKGKVIKRGSLHPRGGNLRTPGVMTRTRKGVPFKKRSRVVKVSKGLRRKIRKVISGKIPHGRHIVIGAANVDPDKSNQIFWHRQGLQTIAYIPNDGQSGAMFSPSEVLRKTNELFMNKPYNGKNFILDTASILGAFSFYGAHNAETHTHNMYQHPLYNALPKIDVVKQYWKSEWVNNTQRAYRLEFYNVKPKFRMNPGIDYNPFYQFIAQMKDNIAQETTTGDTVFPHDVIEKNFRTNAFPASSLAITSLTSTPYPLRPELFPDWNKRWAFSKKVVMLEAGQKYVHVVKGPSGMYDYNKFHTTRGSSDPANQNAQQPTIYDWQPSKTRFCFVGVIPDLIATDIHTGDTPHTLKRVGRVDTTSKEPAISILYETTQYLKVRCPDLILSRMPQLFVNTADAGATADPVYSGSNVTQGSTSTAVAMTGTLIAGARMNKLLFHTDLDMDVPVTDETAMRIDPADPNLIETNVGTIPSLPGI